MVGIPAAIALLALSAPEAVFWFVFVAGGADHIVTQFVLYTSSMKPNLYKR